MRLEAGRVLTTHVGSLPRLADLHAMSVALREGEAVDETQYGKRVRQAVADIADIVDKQAELGLDIVSDSEMSKPRKQLASVKKVVAS